MTSNRPQPSTATSEAGVIFLLDEPDTVRRKVRRAVTDPGTEVSYDPYRRPGVANLLEILAAYQSLNAGQKMGTSRL